jgi:hypothetical protein
MPYSYNIYAGNGSTTQYAVAFPYIRKEHIVAYVNYTLTSAFTWVNDSTIQFTTAPGAGVRVEIRRLTPLPGNLVDYADGSTLVAADLDTSNLQHLYKEQEIDDDIKQSVYVDPLTGFPTASNQRITNVADPVAAQDAATKNYVDTTTVASAGDTMTGVLAMGTNKITGLGNPTNAQDAATKTYVDTTTVASAGDTMTGPLAMGANKVTGLGEPTANQDAATKNYVDSTTWNNTDETIDSTETWVSSNAYIGTTGATTTEMDVRHDTLVQTSTPSGSGWRVGKTWLQNDANKTLSVWNGSAWLGVASGGTFTTQPTVIYVDATNGNDADDGHRIINPKKTIKAAVIAANAGDIIKVAPGVYQEVLPIDVTVTNLSIVGEAQRSCFIHPTVATEQQTMFRCNSGTYIDGFTFAGLKASGTRGDHYVDTDATYGLPANQGWVASFYPGCTITKSPYVNNCTNFADSGIDNSNFNPNNHGGTGGDTTSAPTGGGILVDGSVPDVNSPLRSFVINEFTQINLDGPGLLVCNNGYVQAVSFFGIFCHYHAKALSGGQINMEVGTTNFGRYGLIADGKSNTAIFTATANGAVSTNATTFAINAPTAAGSWFGDATRPALNMLVQVSGNLYPILSATANGAGWNVVISRPNPSNRAENLGLISGHSNGAAVSFFLRSMISTASHTHEYTGAGTSYLAMPENGGVPIEANESVNLNNGRVWLSSVDQNGKFKVGDTFVVDQQTGFVTIDPNSYSTNLVSDLTPELGGDLDVLTRRIYSSLGNVYINDTLEVNSGSAATPAITFNGDTNTGLYRIGADQLGIATNGVLRFTLSTTGATVAFPVDVPLGTAAAPSLTFTGDLNTGIYSSGADVVDVTTGGTAKVRVDNTTAPLKEIFSSVYYPIATQVDVGTDPNQIPLNGYLGTMAFQDAAGVNIDLAAINTATISSAAVTAFSNVPLLTGGGLKFPATQVASADPNTLDDYEEGTFTPTLGGTATYSLQSGFYTKVGRLVCIQFAIEITSLGTGSTTQISGLPFNASSTNSAGSCHYFGSLATNVVYLVPEVNTALAGKIVFGALTAAGGGTSGVVIFQNGTRIDGTVCYITT